MDKDQIYSEPLQQLSPFRFDDSVVKVFPDMIKRSVPGYGTIIHVIASLAERYVQPETRCYDLGCSLGAATLSMRHGASTSQTEIIAVDNSPAMIEKCRLVMDTDQHAIPVHLQCADLEQVEVSGASMVVLNFTLQFVKPKERDAVIQKIFDGMVKGGVLVLSEKLQLEDEHLNELFVDLHHSFKKANGYSDLEIAQKRSALENVLIPETLNCHRERLFNAGFASVDVWFQCFNFASILAIK